MGQVDDRHIAQFTENGWGLQHPPSCRPDLLSCELHRAVEQNASSVRDDLGVGRYEVSKKDGEFGTVTFKRLEA